METTAPARRAAHPEKVTFSTGVQSQASYSTGGPPQTLNATDPKPSAPNLQSSTPDGQSQPSHTTGGHPQTPSSIDPKPSAPNLQSLTLHPQPETRNRQL